MLTSPEVGVSQLSRWDTWFRADRRRLGRRYVSATLTLGAAISFAALLAIAWAAGWTQVWQGAVHADWVWLIVAPVAVLLSHLGYSLTYREVARVGQGPDLAGEEAVAMVTTGFGPFSPRGGFALDAREFRNLGLTKRDAKLRVRALGMIEYATLAPAALACALYLFVTGASDRAGLLPSWIVGVPLGTVGAVGLLILYRRAGRPATWWPAVRHALDAMERTFDVVRSWPNGPLAVSGMSVYWLLDIGALAACMAVFTHRHGVGPGSDPRICHRIRPDSPEPAPGGCRSGRSSPPIRPQLGGLSAGHRRSRRDRLSPLQPLVRGDPRHRRPPPAPSPALPGPPGAGAG